MDNPILSSRGMDLLTMTGRHVYEFVANMSVENQKEFAEVYELDPQKSLLRFVDIPGNYAVVRNGKVLALTGVHTMDDGEGMMWALFTKDMKKQFVRFVRASTDLIQFYHSIYPVLNCDVWIESVMIHQWLALLEFHPEFGYEQNGQQIVRAVRYCSEDETELSSGQRPVVH
jgi:hypothetical protein